MSADKGTMPRVALRKNSTGSSSPAKGGAGEQGASKSGSVFDERDLGPTEFRRFYDRGDLPIAVLHKAGGNKVLWKVPIEKLDYFHFLPIFFDGLRETKQPYEFLAREGLLQMLKQQAAAAANAGGAEGESRVQPVVPQLIIPIKNALNTKIPSVVCTTLKMVQELVLCGDGVGAALVPFYRQILPVFNLFKGKNVNMGDKVDYAQHKRENIGDLVQETLELLEEYGGEEAFIHIKYMVPTYESINANHMAGARRMAEAPQ